MLERREWSIWGIFTINLLTVNKFPSLFQYSGFIYQFQDVLFQGGVYSRRVQFVPKNSKITKWKRSTLGISHLGWFAKFVRVRINGSGIFFSSVKWTGLGQLYTIPW